MRSSSGSETSQTPAPSVFHSLALSLFLWLFAVVAVAFGTYTWLNARITSKQWQETTHTFALRFSELIQRSIHQGMLVNRKDDVQHILEAVAGEPGMEGLRIYDKGGTVVFSSRVEEIGSQADRRAEACAVCHDGSPPLRFVPTADQVRVFSHPGDGHRIFGLIQPIANEPACAREGCHVSPGEQAILGVLDVKISLAEADQRLATTRRLSAGAAVLVALLAGAVSAVFIDRMVRRPVRTLIAGTERVARGDLEGTIPVASGNEIGHLAQAFERMTGDLARAREDNERWASTLEQKVVEKTEELSRAQRQVVHMEKMASLGQLAATVAHELNNPLAGILNYARLAERSLLEGEKAGTDPEAWARDRADLLRFMEVIERESGRCGSVVKNLLLFARRSGSELDVQPLGPIVERALAITRHHLDIAGITVTADLGAGAALLACDGGQIEQALVALIVNAVEAMSTGGQLTVRTAETAEEVLIAVTDTGPGIPAGDLPHIFEPFYTTKTETDGAGLGLAVVYGIITRHGGTVEVEAEAGRGTTFSLHLPRAGGGAGGGAGRGAGGDHG